MKPFCLWLFAFFACAWHGASPIWGQSVLSGVVVGDKALAKGKTSGIVVAGSVRSEAKDSSSYSFTSGDMAIRIDAAYGCFWFSWDRGFEILRVPFDDLKYYDFDDPVFNVFERKPEERLEFFLKRDSWHNWILWPVNEEFDKRNKSDLFGLPAIDAKTIPVLSHFLPLAQKKGVLFILYDRGRVGVFPGIASWKEKSADKPQVPSHWNMNFPKNPLEIIHSSIKGSFTTYAKGKDLFFLTDSGKLFRVVEESRDGKTRKVLAAVWNDPKKPIHAVVTDADADKHYLFGKESKEKGFYFELDARPRPRPFAFADLPDNRAEEHLRTILRYATLLRPAKKK